MRGIAGQVEYCSLTALSCMLQGFVFALVGMAAGLTGTAVSNSLIFVRQKLDPNFKPQNQAPNVVLNAATWATHMGISSNVRYQMLNGLDMVRLVQSFAHPLPCYHTLAVA